MDNSERYWNILQYNIDWLRFSETKAGLILTVHGIIFTIIYTNSEHVFESIEKSTFVLIMVFIYCLLSLMSMWYSFLCINPILKNKNPNSIIYFGHISSKFKSCEEYKKFSKEVLDDEDKFEEQITEQIYLNSKIAWKKYKRVTWSLRYFIGSIATILFILITYLVKNI